MINTHFLATEAWRGEVTRFPHLPAHRELPVPENHPLGAGLLLLAANRLKNEGTKGQAVKTAWSQHQQPHEASRFLPVQECLAP